MMKYAQMSWCGTGKHANEYLVFKARKVIFRLEIRALMRWVVLKCSGYHRVWSI